MATKKNFSVLLRSCLDADTELLHLKLRQAGVPQSVIASLVNETYSEQIIITYAAVLERATGISPQNCMFQDAVDQLWSKHRQLASVTSVVELRQSLKDICKVQGERKAARLLDVHHWTLRKWAYGTSMLRTASIIKLLAGLNRVLVGTAFTAVTQVMPGLTPEPAADQRRRLSAGLSVLHSTIDMLEASCQTDDFLDGDRARILDIIRRLVTLSGITRETKKRLAQIQAPDAELDAIIRAATGKAGDPSRRR